MGEGVKAFFTTTPESPVCKDGDEWDDLLAKPAIGKATPVKVWWFTRKSLGVDIKKIGSILSIKKENIYLPMQRHTDKVAHIAILKNIILTDMPKALPGAREGLLVSFEEQKHLI